VALGKRKEEEDSSKYYYVVYSWEIKGKGSGTGACTITVTAPGEFLIISSVAKDISEKLSRGSVIILNWRELTKKQCDEFVGAPEEEEVTEETKDDTTSNTFITTVITKALTKKFDGNEFKAQAWLLTPRPEWLMMSGHELIKIGDASRVLALLEEEQ